MKKIFTILMVCLAAFAHAQLLSWSPDFIQENSNNVSIVMNANYGNHGLLKYATTNGVYVHTGIITNKSTSPGDWKHVVTTWATAYGFEHATYLGNNRWQFTIDTTGGLRTFYNITDTSEHILKIAILFRSADGNTVQRNADGSDMYVPVYNNGEHVRIDNPLRQPTYTPIAEPITKNVGDALPIVAKASLANSTIQLYFNGSLLSTVSGTKDSISTSIAASGTQTIIAKATNGANTSSDTISFYVNPPNNIAAIPAGKVEGINYEPGDTSVTLVVYAPLKKNIIVLGDFNNWTPSSKYLMNVTPDKNYFWIRLTGLSKGVQYAYQYLIDNSLQLADYNAQLVLDKNADPYIPSGNFPNLKAFPSKAAGTLAGVLQTGQTIYKWNDNSFAKPDKRNLVIYELLVRDFVATQSWNTLADTLSYIKRLGVNAIEVMPFVNFEGASSWGYNPNFFFAPDKQYGTPAALKHFIDVCHQNGMAVIMDLAMQDVFGSSPLVQMYYNGATNTPTHTNPWLDSLPTHPYNVGYEFNHSSAATIDLRNRVYAYWIDSFHLDGFRFDLAGGYTQTDYLTNGEDWQNTYDQGRVNTWDSIYTRLQHIKPNTYCILESFVNLTEQKHYTDNGMLTWGNGGNENYSFNQATMGYSDGWDFSGGIYTSSGLTQPGLVTYQESHDEERIQFKNEAYGNSSGSYNVKDTVTGLQRDGMAAAFWAMMPGPKMLYEFDELGYDYSINRCTDGTTNNDCRTSPKPIRWDYYKNANRLALYNIYRRLLTLKINPSYINTFTTGAVNKNLSGAVKWMSVYNTALQVMVYGNFDVIQQTGTISFPSVGNWYNLFSKDSINVTTTALQNVTLKPGEYYVYVNSASSVLASSWLGFTAIASGNISLLQWSVASSSEANTSAYNIERSTDGLHFTAIGKTAVLKTIPGTSNYTFTDAHPFNGINYYRIAEIDKDGKTTYSAIHTVSFNNNGLWKIYPNPSTKGNYPVVHLESAYSKFEMILSDVSGRQLYLYTTTNAAAGSTVTIPNKYLSTGTYLVKITTDKGSSTQKLIIY